MSIYSIAKCCFTIYGFSLQFKKGCFNLFYSLFCSAFVQYYLILLYYAVILFARYLITSVFHEQIYSLLRILKWLLLYTDNNFFYNYTLFFAIFNKSNSTIYILLFSRFIYKILFYMLFQNYFTCIIFSVKKSNVLPCNKKRSLEINNSYHCPYMINILFLGVSII